MARWIFLEDYKLKHTLNGMINTDFIVRIELRSEYAQLVIFFGAEGHADPHILTFENEELSKQAYDDLKAALGKDSYLSATASDNVTPEVHHA